MKTNKKDYANKGIILKVLERCTERRTVAEGKGKAPLTKGNDRQRDRKSLVVIKESGRFYTAGALTYAGGGRSRWLGSAFIL